MILREQEAADHACERSRQYVEEELAREAREKWKLRALPIGVDLHR
jgi:hypothetical protein